MLSQRAYRNLNPFFRKKHNILIETFLHRQILKDFAIFQNKLSNSSHAEVENNRNKQESSSTWQHNGQRTISL
jgi:hypothetical protein